MENLPADFPQPPADRESLAAAVAWIFQVLSWLIARAAAGDKWRLGLEDIQPAIPEPQAATPDRTGFDDSRRSVALEREATRREAPQPEAQPFARETPPPTPPVPHRFAPRATTGRRSSRPTRQPSRRALAKEPGIRGPGRSAARHSRPATGPPSKTGESTMAPSHVHFIEHS